MAPLFDAYVMVDWSAAARRCRGANSIWWAAVTRDGGQLALMRRENPPTRAVAMAQLAALLGGLADKGRRVLAGFDFPFGYPAGFAKGLGLSGPLPWQGIWALLDRLIEDDDKNGNNRFACAAQLNKMGGQVCFPFWGHPHGHRYDGLAPKKGTGFDETLAERRLVEGRLRKTKTLWQLNGNGSVGGQSLVGIPRLMALCADSRLAGRVRVWPFETEGLSRIDEGEIVIAEVYPSLVMPAEEPGLVKDACQVRSIGNKLAGDDEAGDLAGLFALRDFLTPAEEQRVRDEEGWILGVAA